MLLLVANRIAGLAIASWGDITMRSLWMIAALMAACAAVFGTVNARAQSASVPVMIGGIADLDACQTLSRIVGLKRGGDNFLSVRRGPGVGYAETDRLGPGRQVYSCARSGGWVGIVYGGRGSGCGVTSPVPRRQAYRGPCRSGWVHSRFVQDVAG